MRAWFALIALLTAACGAQCPAPEEPPDAAVIDAAVVDASDVVTRWAPSGKARIDIFVTGSNAFLARLTMEAGAAVPEHRDPTEEYIHVLAGSGTITIDGVEHEVGPGDTVFMPADALVTYQNGDEQMQAFQVFAGPGPASKYDAWLEEPPSP
jgi:quercetin dioxygenase-like cupin family protein